jgi:hypothetical protein
MVLREPPGLKKKPMLSDLSPSKTHQTPWVIFWVAKQVDTVLPQSKSEAKKAKKLKTRELNTAWDEYGQKIHDAKIARELFFHMHSHYESGWVDKEGYTKVFFYDFSDRTNISDDLCLRTIGSDIRSKLTAGDVRNELIKKQFLVMTLMLEDVILRELLKRVSREQLHANEIRETIRFLLLEWYKKPQSPSVTLQTFGQHVKDLFGYWWNFASSIWLTEKEVQDAYATWLSNMAHWIFDL